MIDIFDTFFRVWIEPCPKYKYGAWLELGFDGSITEVYNRQGDTEERKVLK